MRHGSAARERQAASHLAARKSLPAFPSPDVRYPTILRLQCKPSVQAGDIRMSPYTPHGGTHTHLHGLPPSLHHRQLGQRSGGQRSGCLLSMLSILLSIAIESSAIESSNLFVSEHAAGLTPIAIGAVTGGLFPKLRPFGGTACLAIGNGGMAVGAELQETLMYSNLARARSPKLHPCPVQKLHPIIFPTLLTHDSPVDELNSGTERARFSPKAADCTVTLIADKTPFRQSQVCTIMQRARKRWRSLFFVRVSQWSHWWPRSVTVVT